MTLNHYRASQGVLPLSHFSKATSSDSYQELIESGELNRQLKCLVREYAKHPEGLTDVQASKLLSVDPSTLSARRNDLTKKYGSHVLIKSGTRDNGVGRRQGTVWILNPNLIVR